MRKEMESLSGRMLMMRIKNLSVRNGAKNMMVHFGSVGNKGINRHKLEQSTSI